MPVLKAASQIAKGFADPLYRSLPICYQQTFAPLGKVVQVESNDSLVLEAAIESFGRYGDPLKAAKPQIRIQICLDPVANDETPWPLSVFRGREHLFHISCGACNFAVADLKTGIAIGFVSQRMLCDRSFFRNAFLECLFYVLAVHQSHTPVHCACVSLNDRGALICGDSGAGKSTLAYACVRSGMEFVSDDTIHLQWHPYEMPKLWGNPWFLRLLPETSRLFPELSGREARMRSDGESCLELDIPQEFPGQARTSCRPAALVFLERTVHGPTECRPLGLTATLGHLRKNILLDEDSVVLRHDEVLQRLAQIEAYTLSYSGPPPLSAVETLQDLLQK